MADLLGTDEFLVNRNGVTYTQQQETLMASLQDTDHLLINRAGQTYKITGSDLINSVVDPLEVTVILAPTEGYTDVEVTAIPVVSGGKQPDGGFVFTYQWLTADDASGTNRVTIVGANDATFTPDETQVDLFLGCFVTTTDALGTSAEGEAYIGPIQVSAQAPVIDDVTISEIADDVNRFTDKEFPYVTTMTIDGEPAPTYEVKAKVSGTTFDFNLKSDAITAVEDAGGDQKKLTLAGSTDLADMSGSSFATDGTGAPGPYSQTPYKLVTSQITNVVQSSFSATYTGNPYPGYEGPNAFDEKIDKLPFPDGFSTLTSKTSSRAGAGDTITITFNEEIEVTPSSEIWILFQSEPVGASPEANVTLFGTNSNFVAENPDDNIYQNGKYRWLQIPATIGNINKIEINSSNLGIAGLAQVKVDGANIVEGVYSNKLTFASPNPDLQYFKPGDVVQGVDATKEYEIRFYDGSSLTPQQYSSTTFVDKLPFSQTTTVVKSGSQILYDLGGKVKFELVHIDGPDPTPGGIFYFYGSQDGDNWTLEVTVRELNGLGDHPYTRLTSDTKYRYYILRRDQDGTAGREPKNMGTAAYVPDISSYETPTKVISTDVAANTMTVDGGNWNAGAAPRVYSSEQYSLSVPTGQWTDVFSSKEVADGGYIQWGPNDVGTSGTGNSTYDQNGTVVAFFDPPLNGSFKVKCQWSNRDGDSPGTLLVDADSTTLTPTPIGSAGPNFVEMDYGTVVNLRSVGLTANVVASGTSIAGFYLNGVKLVDETASGDNKVEYQTKGGQGDIIDVNTTDNTITLTETGDRDNRWIAGNYGEGSGSSTDFYVAPANAVPITRDHAWCNLQIINNKAQVTGIQQQEPAFTPVPSKDYSIKFPSLFATGNAPDDDLPRGTCIEAIVAAENSEGRDEKESNCLMPADVNPSGAAGPITASTPTTLTVATNSNLSGFSPGDELVMVDENNDISNYTMQTSLIEDVSQQNITGQSEDGSFDNLFSKDKENPYQGVNDSLYVATNSADPIRANFAIPLTGNLKLWANFAADNTSPSVRIVADGGALSPNPIIQNGLIYEYDLGDVSNLTYIELQGDSTRVFWGLVLDGQNIVQGDPVLTFASPNPDLQYFKSGDLVQGAPITGEARTSHITDMSDPFTPIQWNDLSNLVSGGRLIDYESGTRLTTGGFVEHNMNLIKTSEPQLSIGFNLYSYGSWVGNTVTFYGWVSDDGINWTNTNTGPLPMNVGDGSPHEYFAITQESMGDSGDDEFYSWFVGDEEVKVISTDVVANTMTVSGGVWFTSTSALVGDWSNQGTITETGIGSDDYNKLFNGKDLEIGQNNFTESWRMSGTQLDVGSSKVTGLNIPFTSSVKIRYLKQVSTGYADLVALYINDVNVLDGVAETGFNTVELDVTNLVTSPITSWGLERLSAGVHGNVGLFGIYIDGALLVDSGSGDSKVTFGPVTGTGTFQSADLNANTITLSVSNDRWIDNSNRLSKDFYVRDNITVFNADNAKHVAMQQAVAQAFADFPDKVEARRTAIRSSFTRLVDGQALTAEEVATLEAIVDEAT